MRGGRDKSVLSGWRARGHEIIYEADTPAGKLFDVALLLAIVVSVAVVMLDSIGPVRARWGGWLTAAEWFFTVLFTVEYVFRLLCVGRPLAYARSFFGVVDLLAVLPTYASLLVPQTQFLLAIRILRVLRVFRVLKLVSFLGEAERLLAALRASWRKIAVFLFAVLTIVVLFGALMYVLEGAENGFTSIPRAVYWAIVTLTTVGYGDISPGTPLGQAVAALIMILGYGIIAVPTGLVSAELMRAAAPRGPVSTQACPQCGAEGHDADAAYCKFCGAHL
jgi:voltage-gated potassium channel